MGSSSKQAEATRAVNKFEKVRKELINFLIENPKFGEVLVPLVERYNTLRVEAKNSVRDLPGNEKVSVGSFHRSRRPKATVYSAAHINHEILSIPGVVKEVDTKMIDRLVLSGNIDRKDVENGRKEVYGTAKVTAPPVIQLKILD